VTALQGQGLLDAAAATGDPKLARLVEKVRALLAEIRDGLAAAEAQREAREKVARLEAELAAAKAELQKGKPARRAAAPRRYLSDIAAEVVKRFEAGEKPAHIAKSLGCGTATVYRALREAGVELRGHAR
jgi:DNA invertase Pin-like site-specific DNA recombinase